MRIAASGITNAVTIVVVIIVAVVHIVDVWTTTIIAHLFVASRFR